MTSSSVDVDAHLQPAESDPLSQEDIQTLVQNIRDVEAPPPEVILPPRDEAEDGTEYGSSCYWDAASMAPLNAVSAAAIARLRAYKPPSFPLWDRLHTSRRAAVLLLLFADRRGDLRVVITMRAASLRSFSGHAAFPGGKADSPDETPYQIARREAWEEIGLPLDDAKLPTPFRIEHLCYLPMNLARTGLVVRPCVAFLHVNTPPIPAGTITSSKPNITAEESLIPRLDAKEVAAVFSAPFHNFLLATDEDAPPSSPPPPSATTTGEVSEPKQAVKRSHSKPKPNPEAPGKWYDGSWMRWNGEPWRVHYFGVPVTDQRVMKPRRRLSAGEEEAADELGENGRYKVWGMTARIIVDAARIAYDEAPEFEHNGHFGDETMILELDRQGLLEPKPKYDKQIAREDAKVIQDTKKNGDESSKM